MHYLIVFGHFSNPIGEGLTSQKRPNETEIIPDLHSDPPVNPTPITFIGKEQSNE